MADGIAGSIAVDWGTSNFRAYRLAADGSILEERKAAAGISTVENGAFAATLMQQIGDWLAPNPATPVIMAGMIGSRNGWVEAPYAPLPCGPDDLRARLVQVPLPNGGRALIVPGISGVIDGIADVMRGEETLTFGLGLSEGIVLSAGTHPKWIEVKAGKISRFQSFMTGEIYALMSEQSLLARLAEEPASDAEIKAGFERGLDYATHPAGLTRSLFAARTEVLLGRMTGGSVKSFLSGLLIGHEILGAKASFGLPNALTLLTTGAKVALYRDALASYGVACHTADMDDMLIAGLSRIVSIN